MLKKLCSMKLWVTFWAMGLLTFIVIANRESFMSIATVLAWCPIGYLGVNVAQKKILADSNEEQQ